MLMKTKKKTFPNLDIRRKTKKENAQREKAPLISLVHVSPCYKNILLREFNCIITDY